MKYHSLFLITAICLTNIWSLSAQDVDYSITSVPEEEGLNFVCISSQSDYVCMPLVERRNGTINWLSNRIMDISPDGTQLAYLSFRNNTTNIFIKSPNAKGISSQRTNRTNVLDFRYSPDGKYICFSETVGNANNIFQTDAKNGYVCRQITSGSKDYSPMYSSNMTQLFFTRQEGSQSGIWSYNVKNNFLSSYTIGMNPCPIPKTNSLLCTRINAEGRGEIWKIDYVSGIEECIVSDARRSFSTPSLSPDGQWILFVGSSYLQGPGFEYANTDIFVCKTDGTQFGQLTYHAADDICPIWSNDGKQIYFISQRGSAEAIANIWRINFPF